MLRNLKPIGYFCFALALILSLELIGLNAAESKIRASDRPNPNQARQFLEQGIELYEQEAFTSARNIWLKSGLLYAQQQDILGEALALNNLALAHQQLGEWGQSQQAIAKSLKLLQEGETLAQQPGYWEILAKASNTEGNWQWQTGQIQLALASWQNTTKYYTLADYQPGAIKAQINQAKALQGLGFTVRAVKLLTTVNQSLAQEPNSELKAIGLRYLGIGYRNLGQLAESAEILQQSINITPQDRPNNLGWLELGNTYRQQRDRNLAIGKETLAQEYFEQAMQAYEQAATSEGLALRAQLNQLSLLIEAGESAKAAEFSQKISFPVDLEANRANVYALLNYSRSLVCLHSPVTTVPICNSQSDSSIPQSEALSEIDFNQITATINLAIAQAQSLQDTIAEAQALSQLAEVDELQGNWEAARKLSQQALLSLEGTSSADITYLLHWQLGRILRQQGKLSEAILAYNQAIAALEAVRENILSIDPLVQFSFRDRVEPVYREAAELLLTTQGNTTPSQQNLQQAIRIVDALQLAELENFLGCDLSRLINLDETTVDPTAAQIYPIILSDRLITIIALPGKPLEYREIKVSQEQVTTTLTNLQNNLSQPGKTPELLQQAQQVYQWLLQPLESLLTANSQIKTLVFVPDSLLRNIPFNILYDGKQYFIEKGYALAVSPRLELFAPTPSSKPLNILTGGVEISQTIEGINFPAIAQVQQELNQIATEIPTNEPLLNEAFTEANIKQQLQQGDFSAIHWKTHGVFSSDPTETFLVAYQDSIKANELQLLVQTAIQEEQKPLELLVLSACETAKGDNRAILGLAGLTVKTGARTALSTLWRADDRATTLLMTRFYQQLVQPGTTKAEALRQAQLYLINEEGYFAPHYWGTYILVGNWL
ncbi:MAG TPA: CHAT domain-containing protein [Xenococcaceae cyanobacterium]